ncbi:pyridoxamine 5'-phosphate oxidase [Phaeocystidibacter luteus]|uniref:Pyridoxine/pyridoxamine 5'-phosphate oxidase n=1 Tax=Phaeocystidibacter luteus TaxID=911197 RepID=A0A6N6RL26_9FLAO|nr:pyridoxamine 5'-phosphate oxidase [Phaeocystidibacter luteus]KAB2814367.1 pyridoxamine 5'-phosphate oxidase [Phaeocystidibacter luteus]
MKDSHLRKDRRDYTKGELLESEVPGNPFDLFQDWFADRSETGRPDATAMTLSTVGLDGRPDARIVLLKGIENGGFEFFTNYQSKKGQDLEHQPIAHLLFFWPEVERQVRVVGRVTKLSYERNSKYFKERPVGSQVGALSSPQSRVLDGRSSLESTVQANLAKYGEEGPDCPEFWGGYSLVPEEIEFWQGRSSRLHDRLRFSKSVSGWKIERLAP